MHETDQQGSLVRKRSDNMELHLLKMTEWMDELAEIGHTLQEKNACAIILASLSEDYDGLICALESRDEALKLEVIKPRLLDGADKKVDGAVLEG